MERGGEREGGEGGGRGGARRSSGGKARQEKKGNNGISVNKLGVCGNDVCGNAMKEGKHSLFA